MLHSLLIQHYKKIYEFLPQEEDDFFAGIIEFISKFKFKIEKYPHALYKSTFDSTQIIENLENFICNLLESINFFLKSSIGEKTFEVLLKFFKASYNLTSPKIFEMLFIIIFNKYNLLNEKNKHHFFNELINSYQKNEFILRKLSKNRSVIKDIYDYYQKEYELVKGEEFKKHIEDFLCELLIYKILKTENFEEEIFFFMIYFSKNYFRVRIKILSNVIDKLVKKEGNENPLLQNNLIKVFLYLTKDFYLNRNLALEDFVQFISIMESFFKYFLDNEILFSFLVPNISKEKFKEINLVKFPLELQMIPKIEGIFYPFFSLLYKILQMLFKEFRVKDQELVEKKIESLLIFIKKVVYVLRKKEINEKNKKFSESNDFEKIIIENHSKNYRNIEEKKLANFSFGIHFKNDFLMIYDFLLYKILKFSMIAMELIDDNLFLKNIKEAKFFKEILNILYEFSKNSETVINLLNNIEEKEKISSFSEILKIEKKSLNKKENFFTKIYEKIKKIQMILLEKEIKQTNEEEKQLYQQKIKEFFSNFFGNSNTNDIYTNISENKTLIKNEILPLLYSEKLFTIYTVQKNIIFINLFFCR